MIDASLTSSWPGLGIVVAVSGVLVYLLRRIIKGALVPIALMNARMADKAELAAHLVEENKELREANSIKDKTINTLSDQVKEAMEASRTATAALEAVRRVAQNRISTESG